MKPSTVILPATIGLHTQAQDLTAETPSTLNITAISAKDGISTIECWTLDAKFDVSDEPGTVGAAKLAMESFGGGEATYSVIPPKFDGGLHNAPNLQWVVFLSGLAHITLPNGTEEAFVRGGENGVDIAVDTADVSEWGHSTEYPGEEETVGIEIPFSGGIVPAHRALHDGPCKGSEIWK